MALILAIVFASLVNAGTFKRANILIKSNGDWDLNQQQVTYFIWSDIYQQTLQNAYIEAYTQNTTGSQLDYNAMIEKAINAAAGTVQQMLATAIKGNGESEGYASFLTKFVAVLDAAEGMNLDLTDEELEAAETSAEEMIDELASSFSMSRKKFLENAIGCNVQMKDIKSVAVMEALYTKVMTEKDALVREAIELPTLVQYRDENAESYYSTDFLAYVLQEGETKADENDTTSLESILTSNQITSAKDFNTALLKYEFNKQYAAIFNKYVTEADADALEVALTLKDENRTAQKLDEAITAAKTAEEGKTAMLSEDDKIATYDKNNTTLPADVITWMFGADRAAFDIKQVEIKNNDTVVEISLVVLKTTPADDKVDALVKKYTMADGKSFGEDVNFMDNILNTLLVECELLEKADDMKLYDTVEDKSTEDKILDDLRTAIDKKLPKTDTAYYDKDITATDLESKPYLSWMFGGVGDTLEAPAEATDGKVHRFSKTDDKNVTTVTIYCIEKAMKLDEEKLVDGGYVSFDTEAEANSFLATLEGLTGDALADKFTEASATVSSSISESGLDAELTKWLFDEQRAENNTSPVIKGTNDKFFVAFYSDNAPAWQIDVENDYVEKQLTDWTETIGANYSLNESGMKWIKDKISVEDTTAEDEHDHS